MSFLNIFNRLWIAFNAQESFLVRFWSAFIPLFAVAYLIVWILTGWLGLLAMGLSQS